jgi:hypothetical protein
MESDKESSEEDADKVGGTTEEGDKSKSDAMLDGVTDTKKNQASMDFGQLINLQKDMFGGYGKPNMPFSGLHSKVSVELTK